MIRFIDELTDILERGGSLDEVRERAELVRRKSMTWRHCETNAIVSQAKAQLIRRQALAAGLAIGGAGFVYFIGDRAAVKIGFTESFPGRRLRALQTGSSSKLSLIGYVRGDATTEARLHQHFASRRTIGEWFELTADEARNFIATAGGEVVE